MKLLRLLLVLLPLLTLGCGGSSTPTSPTPSAGTNTGGTIPVSINLGGGVTNVVFTAQINGQTYTAFGLHTVNLPVGTHVISGTYRGQSFGVTFFRFPPATGGAESGSVQLLQGSGDVLPCRVIFSNVDAPTADRPFRIQFRVTSNANSVCQLG